MHKLLLSLLLGSTLSFASMVNGVAILVNEEPITLYDIERTMVVNKIPKNEAVSYLIDKILYDQLVQEYNITADIFEVNDYIEKLANSNGMDIYAFKAIIKQEYPDYSVFENEAKNTVIRQKLVQKLVKGQLAIANDEDMQLYYEKNRNKYLTAKTFDVTQYSSTSKEALMEVAKNPIIIPSEVQRTSLKLNTEDIQAQLQYLLNGTKVNSFTPIFTANKQYVTFFITKKEGTAPLSYESVKARIFNDIMMNREQKYLKDYFEKQKLIADIKVIR
ncbi:peptidylprolyl isomerase [Aliarcobacter butzleri]|uniref:peptidylprolyl isomerase n=2 Tax=Aliarcobacter butzleri TaxID=28197 RepID=UPI000659B432|nr:peptidylprolyl isomerase [Aliarcobacter butzleri]KLE07293.1 SurA domain-containing protein [Aliarcobacter butzleri L353]MCG3676372.1 peptidyl-prolyl cis-trans isomerase [Aliarcobacter butzleri]MCG3687930.1 peptidyl-prolyl cis-trans isomerase [Aliarcobacter butzleri]MCG3697030.1 peptidyl-prolyl cis-trans isomerase [Aliarcobacter butzleri]MCG3699699.1 peptidyl-prolyl cis-trans isomerase [Aliarcobacter butzleri]